MRSLTLTLLMAVVACKASTGNGELPPPPASVKVLEDTAVIKQGAIGVKDRQDATYVLVDAENGSPEPRLVSLEGTLVDAEGKELGRLFVEELRIPAGERRTYALAAAAPLPAAKSAKLRVRAAPVGKDEPIVIVREQTTKLQPTGMVASVTVENKITKQALATVIVSFYDAQGRILARPFTPVPLLPRSTNTFTFTGPLEAAKAVAYIGDTAF